MLGCMGCYFITREHSRDFHHALLIVELLNFNVRDLTGSFGRVNLPVNLLQRLEADVKPTRIVLEQAGLFSSN